MHYANENGVGGNCAFNGKFRNALLMVLKMGFIFFMLHIICLLIFEVYYDPDMPFVCLEQEAIPRLLSGVLICKDCSYFLFCVTLLFTSQLREHRGFLLDTADTVLLQRAERINITLSCPFPFLLHIPSIALQGRLCVCDPVGELVALCPLICLRDAVRHITCKQAYTLLHSSFQA